jgi:ATP/maltotriose-dependent transcriptional regulator MalT
MAACDQWDAPDRLITTKLAPTALDGRLVTRSSLVTSKLQGTRRPAVISIVASAGSGKSTLMAELFHSLHAEGVHTGWLTLEADENSPPAFALYFLSALASVDPRLAGSELAVLRADPQRDLSALFDGLVKRLSALDQPTSIFLDDFQHVTDDRILRFLNNLVAHLPTTLRLVIGSRVQLPLDLARHRVSGDLIEVGQDELNFTSPQAAAFLKRYHALELSPFDLETLLDSTEGWPTGVQLAAIALRRHRGPASDLIQTFSGRDKDLTGYLAETVIRAQPDLVRTFLLRTSPLRRMSPALCQATSGHPNSAEMLEHLERSNLFLIPLDRTGHWFRYHHLFAEFLQNELRRTDPEGYRSVCDRAAEWCESEGQTTEAIQYALDAERFEKAADLIARHALTVTQFEGDHFTVLDWVRRLPAKYHDRAPEILLSHAWAKAFSRDTPKAMELSQQVIDELARKDSEKWRLSSEQRVHFEFCARVVQAVALACADEVTDCLARSAELRTCLPESEPFFIASICNSMGYAYLCKRDFERCADVAAEAYRYGNAAGAAYATSWADFLHCTALVEMGQLRAGAEFARRAIDNARTESPARGYRNGLASLLNAEIATQQCDFETAEHSMRGGRFFIAVFGPVEPLFIATRNEARLQAWGGRLEAARQTLHQGQDSALRTQQHRLFITLSIEEATLQILAGDLEGALNTARKGNLRSGPDAVRSSNGARGLRDAIQILEARFHLEEGEPAKAVRLLTTMQQSRNAESAGAVPLTIRALRAVALWKTDRRSDATRELDKAITLAASEFQAYPIAAIGKAILPIVAAIEERRSDEFSSSELAGKFRLQRRICAILRGEAPPETQIAVPTLSDSAEALTMREKELLRHVQAGLANRELSQALLVSESTVKWHLHNIYEKLQVRSRSAAVARAREMRML